MSPGRGAVRQVPLWQHRVAVLLLALLSALAAEGLYRAPEAGPLLRALEARTLDSRYEARESLGGAPPPDPAVTLVLLDEESLRRNPEILALWLPRYTRVIRAALRHGARVVGFDVLYRIQVPEEATDPAAERDPLAPLYDRLRQAQEEMALLLVEHPGRVVLIASADPKDRSLLRPVDVLAAAAGEENLGCNNLTQDEDGIWRRQAPWLSTRPEGPGGPEVPWPAFSLLLASRQRGLPLQADPTGTPLWNGRPLPLVEGRMMVNFPGPRNPFPKVPFREVEDRIEAGDDAWLTANFRDRLVLLGPGYAASNDFLPTPFNTRGAAVEMAGVECHANAANTLLTERFLRRVDIRAQWALLGAAVLVAALAAYSLGPWGTVAALLALLGAIAAGAVALFVERGEWLLVTPLATGVLLAFGSVSAYRHWAIDAEKRRMRRLFERYAPEQVVRALMRSEHLLRLGGHRRTVTVFFSDINHFSTLSERLPPERVIALLNEYLHDMLEIIFGYEGTVRQFVGDEIMVLYGAPVDQPDQAVRAVRTAVDMVRHLERRKREAGGADGFYEVKIGIHTGDVVVGNVGSEKRAEYTAVGDNVNLAARLEAMNKTLGTSILVSDEVRARVGDLPGIRFTYRGAHSVKGREQKVEVYEVTWDREEAAPPDKEEPAP